MDIQTVLKENISAVLSDIYGLENQRADLQATRPEFAGDLTLLAFPYVRASHKSPEDTAREIGAALKERIPSVVKDFNVVKGFLNIELSQDIFIDEFKKAYSTPDYGYVKADENAKAVMVEYSSPNTNKPLHLGHVRNNLLGYSVAKLLEASGKKVYKTQIINDRGIHICKSMLAWELFGGGETPESSGMKGDKLVGKYYVEFDKAYKKEVDELKAAGMTEEEAKKNAPLMKRAQQMLLLWETGDPHVRELWERMNRWVYDGFGSTYKRLGVEFDKNYYESQTYLLGKDNVEEGLEKGVFYRRADGSVWIDLSGDGLDEKLVLRGDGTSVYITQDIGTAIKRFGEFDIDSLIYTVGNEQDYHFKVLFLILKKLGYAWADKLYHLSYGMVDLPTGKMKSREGTVVDADDLMDDMYRTAKEISEELGKLEGMDEKEKDELYNIIGMGALKYFILKVDPRKRMMFNPKESIDFNGNTGPFIQYAYARIQSVKRKFGQLPAEPACVASIDKREESLIKNIAEFPAVIQKAAAAHSPALVANYVYDLVKEYNSYYQNVPMLSVEDAQVRTFRVQLSDLTGRVIKSAMAVLGIPVPERM
ncbi:MAG: arginine--tRNA ligase [Flavobacteriales bacterium]|nr:MAG: arginine--tRNA ligase [Flavobacteriales bacterium]